MCSTSGKFTDGLSHAWKVRSITFEWLNMQMNIRSVQFSPDKDTIKKAFLSYIVDRKIACCQEAISSSYDQSL